MKTCLYICITGILNKDSNEDKEEHKKVIKETSAQTFCLLDILSSFAKRVFPLSAFF